MYKKIFRPLMFMLPPETIHTLIVLGMKIGFSIPFMRKIARNILGVQNKQLEREVCGIKFKNPVGMAAGFDKNADMYENISAMGFGFMEVGTIVPKAQPGNPKPRIFRLPKDGALINRMGFPSKGLKYASKHLLDRTNREFVIAGNLGKNTATPNDKAHEDYLTSFRALYDNVDYFVVNVSCPNVTNLTSLQNNESLKLIINGLTEYRRGQDNYRPIMLKIAPTLTNEQIDDILEVIEECGIDGVVATNTTTSREGLKTSPQRVEEIKNGGLSGAPLTERSLEVISYISKKTQGKLAIVGVGGVMTEDDAIDMLKAGASLILLYTGYIYNGPMFVKRICKRILKEQREGKL